MQKTSKANLNLHSSQPSSQEIINHAKFLGMDPNFDQNLLYIAKEALTAPTPTNWKKREINGEIEYHNLLTKEVIKEHPFSQMYKRHYLELKGMESFDNKENLMNENKNKEGININEAFIKNLALEYQIKLKQYEEFKNIELKEKEKEAFKEENNMKSELGTEDLEHFNQEVDNVKAIRKKEFEERKKMLQIRINLLMGKKIQLEKLKDKSSKEIDRVLEEEKMKLEEDHQSKMNEIHLKLMNQFSYRMNACIMEFQKKFEEKKFEVFQIKRNETKDELIPYYENLLQRELQNIEDQYKNFEQEYEDSEMLKAEEMAMNEHQNNKFVIIQSKINEINMERLKFDEELKENWQIFNENKLQEKEKKQKIEDLKHIIHNLKQTVHQNPEQCQSALSEFEAIIEDLQMKLFKINDETDLLKIELTSISHNLEDSSYNEHFLCSDQENKNEIKELCQTIEKIEQEITILKQKGQESRNISFGDTTINKQSAGNSMNSSIMEKNYSNFGFFKAPLKLFKKNQYQEKSFISVKNDESYLSDIQSNDEKMKRNSNKSEFFQIRTKNFPQKIVEIKKDWNQVLSLEKEKNHLMLDNLRKEKVIFENRNKEEEWLIRNQGNSHENYQKYIKKFQKLLKEELIQLKTKERTLKNKNISLKNLEKIFFSSTYNEEENSLMDEAYKEYKQIDINKTNKNKEFSKEPSNELNLSGLSLTDDCEFYQNWIEILNNQPKETISPYKFEEDETFSNLSKEEFNCTIKERISDYKQNLNVSLDRSRKITNKRTNQSFHLERTTFVQSDYSRSSKGMFRNIFKNQDNMKSMFLKHNNWLSSLKTQLSANYYAKPYEPLIKTYSTSPFLKKI